VECKQLHCGEAHVLQKIDEGLSAAAGIAATPAALAQEKFPATWSIGVPPTCQGFTPT
jgi:hypothetical protein